MRWRGPNELLLALTEFLGRLLDLNCMREWTAFLMHSPPGVLAQIL